MKTDQLKIVIISGGTGATELIHGLKDLDKTGKALKITNIINPYDDGASCGIVREQINVIGPGDLRKNQWYQHKFGNKEPNKGFEEFCNNRYDLPKDKEAKFVCDLLDKWDFTDKEYLKSLVKEYFEIEKYEGEYKSFNISNIVYGMMIYKEGSDWTFRFFQKLFGNTDEVILNSLDNMKLMGITKSGKILKNETPDIIKHNDPDDPIEDIFFIPFEDYLDNKDHIDYFSWMKDHGHIFPNLNVVAHSDIYNADLIIFSAGTQWSSLIPTYATKGFNEALKLSKAKKILLMNNIEDGDMLGQDNEDVLKSIGKYLRLDDIDIFINKSVPNSILNKDIGDKFNNSNIFYKELGFINDKYHDPYITSVSILEHYYNINEPEICFFDFDDTIYSRDVELTEISNVNLELLNELSKQKRCVVVSGNDYETIHSKLVPKYGSNVDVKFDIWADSGVVKYKNGNRVSDKPEFYVEKPEYVYDILTGAGIPSNMISFRGDWPTQEKKRATCISIKPLEELEKKLVIYIMNENFLNNGLENIAMKMGRTSVDIMNINTNKVNVLGFEEYRDIDTNKMLYVGDEIHDGNDREISALCGYRHNVKSPYETNILLNLMLEKLNGK